MSDINNRIIDVAIDDLKRQGFDKFNYQPSGDNVEEALQNALASEHADQNMVDTEHCWEAIWYAMHYEA